MWVFLADIGISPSQHQSPLNLLGELEAPKNEKSMNDQVTNYLDNMIFFLTKKYCGAPGGPISAILATVDHDPLYLYILLLETPCSFVSHNFYPIKSTVTPV